MISFRVPQAPTTGRAPEGTRPRRRPDALAILGLAVLSLTFFWRELFTDHAPFWGDILLAFYPAQHLWRQSILHGHLPLWNPYIFTGMPLFGDAQYSIFYPSMLLNLFLPLHRALATDLALHAFMLAAFMYLFLRRLSLSVMSAFLGAVVLAFSGFVAVRVHHVSLIRTLAWLPLLLYIVAGFSPRRGVLRTALAIGVVLALMVFAGHAQTILISGLVAAIFGVWRSRSLRHTPSAPVSGGFVPLVAALALGAVIASLLAAAQILPAAELVRQSERSGGTDFGFATSFSLPVRQLPMLFSPRLFGTPTRGIYWGEWLYWEMVGYAGIVPLVLALVGLMFAQRGDRFFWLAIGLAGVGLALGKALFLYPVAYWLVPGLAYFRVPARFLCWYALAVAALAAVGLDRLRQGLPGSRPWTGFSVLAATITVGAIYWAAGGTVATGFIRWLAEGAMRSATFFPVAKRPMVPGVVGDVAISEGRRFLVFWVGAIILIILSRSRRSMVPFAATSLVLLSVVDLFSFGMGFYPTTQPASLYRRTTTANVLDVGSGAYRILTTPGFSFAAWSGTMTFTAGLNTSEDLASFRHTLLPNMNVQEDVPNVVGYSPIVVRTPQQFISLAIRQAAQNGGVSPLLDFLGTRYIFSPASLAFPLRKVPGARFNVWQNDNALPRGYLVTRYIVEPDAKRRGELLVGGIDLRRVVILERVPSADFGLVETSNPGRIIRRSYGLNEVSFDLELIHPAILVLSDAYYTGWQAFVDGVRQPVHRANHAFRAVFLPANAKRVEFVYAPDSARLGLMITGVAWPLLALTWFIWGRGPVERTM